MVRKLRQAKELKMCKVGLMTELTPREIDVWKFAAVLGDAVDQEIVKAAAGSVATLTTYSSKLCQKIYESSQWEACFLNVLCSHVTLYIELWSIISKV